MKIDSNTYICSDPHYNHKNLVRGCTSWNDKHQCRDFPTLHDHNDALVYNINRTVPQHATLICLGDWSFGGVESIWEFRSRINCKDIHLIFGNHDHHIENNRELVVNGEEELARKLFGDKVQSNVDDFFIKAQDLFTSVQWQLHPSYKVDGHTYYFVLNHCAMRVWPSSHKGSIMLYGHSHGTLDEMTPNIANPTWIGDEYYIRNYRTMDVGFDTHPEFRPYHIDEIVEIMKDRPVGFEIDHHSPKNRR